MSVDILHVDQGHYAYLWDIFAVPDIELPDFMQGYSEPGRRRWQGRVARVKISGKNMIPSGPFVPWSRFQTVRLDQLKILLSWGRRLKVLRSWGQRYQMRFLVPILVSLFLLVYLWDRIFIAILPGHAGVLWQRFSEGTVIDKTYGEGVHITAPWNKMYIYDVRLQRTIDRVHLLSSNGLFIDIQLSIRFFPEVNRLPLLHQSVGENYMEVLIKPEVISALRRVIGNYTAEEIYSKDENGLLQEMHDEVSKNIDRNIINFQDVLLLELKLPEALQDAINDKLTKEQIARSYVYRLEREKSEKERRRIEAEGIKAFETISGISILKWRGIEATEALANSPNTKFVIIGTDSNELPIILNSEK